MFFNFKKEKAKEKEKEKEKEKDKNTGDSPVNQQQELSPQSTDQKRTKLERKSTLSNFLQHNSNSNNNNNSKEDNGKESSHNKWKFWTIGKSKGLTSKRVEDLFRQSVESVDDESV